MHPRAYVFPYAGCLSPYRRTDRPCRETGWSCIGILPKSSDREPQRSPGCSRYCRAHSQGAQTPFYLGQYPLEFSHRNIGDVDLGHEHPIRFGASKQFLPRTFCMTDFASLSILAMVFRIAESASLPSSSVCKIWAPMCVWIPRCLEGLFGSFPRCCVRLHLCRSYTEDVSTTVTTSSRSRYSNKHISSTNTGSSNRGWSCVRPRFSAR